MTELYNTIKLYEIDYEGWGRKIFCRELAEEIINVVEKYYVLKKDKNS